MFLDSWTTAKKDSFESAEVFAQPPGRSRQFLAATSLVALLTVLDILVLVRLYDRLSFISATYILLVLVIAFGNWMRTLVVHRRLHDLYQDAKVSDSPSGSPVDLALRAASTLSYWGTLASAMAGGVGLLALIQFIKDNR